MFLLLFLHRATNETRSKVKRLLGQTTNIHRAQHSGPNKTLLVVTESNRRRREFVFKDILLINEENPDFSLFSLSLSLSLLTSTKQISTSHFREELLPGETQQFDSLHSIMEAMIEHRSLIIVWTLLFHFGQASGRNKHFFSFKSE